MRAVTLIILGSVLMHAAAHADKNQITSGPPPAWATASELLSVPDNPSGLIFVRRQDVLVHLDDQGQAQYLGYRFKILHANALQIGNISVAWNPAAGRPTVHYIKIFRDGEVIDILKKASFDILRREDQLETASLDGILTAVLHVPDLRVGDELEVGLTTRQNDPTLGEDSAGVLMLAPSPAAGQFRLGLSWTEGRKPNIKMTDDMTAVAKNLDRAVEFRFDNPGTLTPPKDAPPRLQWQRIVEYSDFADWPSVSARFAPLYAKAAKISDRSPLKQEISRIASTHATPIERARAALKLVQQNVRYIYVGLDGGNLTPAAADTTWQRRYGDCKGKTALLLGLLAELGIDAEAVLVNNSGMDDGLDERLPSPRLFDHILVRAQIDGKAYWLDGTLPPVAAPGLTPAIPYRWVLPVTQNGSSLEQLKWQPAKRPDEINMIEIDARAGFDKPAQVTSTTISRGIKGLQQQVQLSGVSADQLRDALRPKLVGATWQAVDDVKWRYDEAAAASIMTISGTWSLDWDDDGDGAKSLALPGGGFSPPEKRIRPKDQNQTLPFYNQPEYDCRVTTVRLPSSTSLANWSSKPGYDAHIFGKNYYRAFEFRDGAVRMIRGFRVERDEIDAASAEKDNARVPSFDNSMAWIFYDPATHGLQERAKHPVPATYDIDWTADTVPCLSPDATR